MKPKFDYVCDICEQEAKRPLKVNINITLEGVEGFYAAALEHYEVCFDCYSAFKRFVNERRAENEACVLSKLG